MNPSNNVSSLAARQGAAPANQKRLLNVSVGKTVSSNRVSTKRVPWHNFIDKLNQPTVTGETYAEFLAMSPDEQDAAKDVGYYVFGAYTSGIRKRENLPFVDAVVLDLDHCDADWDFDLPLAFSGTKFVIHSTHKHCPDKPRLRQIFPLSRRVTPEEYEPIARALAAKYDLEVYDKTTFQFSRVMHWPSHARDGEYICEEYDGKWINPNDLLDGYKDWRDVTEWPRHQGAKAPRVTGDKAPDPRDKPGWVGAFCRTYSISDALDELIPDVYTWTGDTRLTYNGGSTTDGAEVYSDLHLYSHHESDPCSQRLCNAFDLVRIHLFGHLDEKVPEDTPINKLPSHAAFTYMLDNDATYADVKVELTKDNAERNTDEFEDLTATDDGAVLDDAVTPASQNGVTVPYAALTGVTPPPSWQSDLKIDSNGNVMKVLSNIVSILKYDNAWGLNVRFNEFARSHVVTKSLPNHKVKGAHALVNGDLFTDRDVSQLKLYLEKTYRLNNISVDMIWHAVEVVGTTFAFHPVLNYFKKLPAWDGTPRLDTLLVDYLGAPDTALVRAMTRKTLCGAINRINNPGSKFDYMLVLEGLQGIRKGMFLRTLAKNDSWFCEGVGRDLGDKATENMLSKWLIELPEGEGIVGSSRSTIDDIKAFVTRQSDRMRPKYTRVAVDFPRQCIFVMTTNRGEYLQDETGNRRFWPVRCGIKTPVDIKTLKQNVDQIWAEAHYRWTQGEKLWLDTNMDRDLEAQHNERTIDDGLAGKIAAWLETPLDHEFSDEGDDPVYRDVTCVRQIWVECLGETESRITRGQSDQVLAAMKRIEGWRWTPRQQIKYANYGRQKSLVRVESVYDDEATPDGEATTTTTNEENET